MRREIMFKVGDKVVCVESTKGITYGKVYTVLDGNKWSDMSVIEIVDDVDDKAWYYTSRFTSAIITNPDPQVTIPESEYHSLIE
jgi:inosine-uridine nucleoside N-ribohydrolase